MAHIDCFFSTLSPYTYLAGERMEAVAERHGASVTYKPVDFMALMQRVHGRANREVSAAVAAYTAQDLARIARREGMEITLKPAHWPTNPAPSAYAIIAAQASGGGDVGALARAFLRACWAEERDVAEDEVVRECLVQAGFDPALADSGLLSGAETYARNLEEAVERGVIGIPFYLCDDGAAFWGQDRIADLDAHLGGTI
ncbi:2-hydroxychromene-2-carboxylate isomerase [Roseovarius sp. SCSIO 43702]|uniref:2-hydroxychromene-2-carboxylate isomerase n=1 Tax=Roseovarius sp. SCSIO 43702 TaxID=2823043 RepID=UPI001C72D0F7|nr:2-hydroxychromene-2-carboxylate isomerase [Roseovarius sp. SCSIO 43702]QYX57707.1 2-hydroxychromene-2-carboxylate isomerase [Roseovarius sp. SCSIO 43702]